MLTLTLLTDKATVTISETGSAVEIPTSFANGLAGPTLSYTFRHRDADYSLPVLRNEIAKVVNQAKSLIEGE